MLDSNDLALWCALNRLISDYWADVDENGGQTAHEFYVPEGLYAIGNNRFEGQEQIQAFYARRRYGTVMTRHLVSNVRVLGEDERHARTLGFIHPITGKQMFFEAELPEDMKQLIEKWRTYVSATANRQ